MSNVVLVGYMGCGKTTVGKNLARDCGYRFLDTDEEIEKKYQRTISDIFAIEGEKAFRDMETAFLQEMLESGMDGVVVSTGGGMPVREENRTLLQKIGMVVYLKAQPQTIYERIKGDTKRPLLQCDDPLAKINDMMKQRAPIYEATAHEIICVDALRQSEIAASIVEMM